MEEIIKIAIVAIISVILALIVAEKTPFFSMCIVIIAGVYILSVSLSALDVVMGGLNQLMQSSGLDSEVFDPVIKVCIIAIIVKISGDICKDAGFSAITQKLQFAGSVASIMVIFPLFLRIINILREIL